MADHSVPYRTRKAPTMTTKIGTTTYCDGCTGRPSVHTYIVDHAVWTEYTEATVSLCATCEAEFYPAGGHTLTTDKDATKSCYE